MRHHRSQKAQFARDLEADAEKYPDERGETLLEAAHQWHLAGEDDRAIALYTDIIAMGGEDAGCARVSLADLLYELGHDDEARSHLDAVLRDRPASSMPFDIGAELLEMRGEHTEALKWFNMAIARLSDDDMATSHLPMSYSGSIISGRRRLRRTMGLPPDELDSTLVEDEEHEETYAPPLPAHVQVLFWPRTQIREARERWPEIVQHDDVDAVMRDRELENRAMAEAGNRIVMLPVTVAGLTTWAEKTGTDPLDTETRFACAVATGQAISWPPERNAPCWCGSRVKYKKCCGRPG